MAGQVVACLPVLVVQVGSPWRFDLSNTCFNVPVSAGQVVAVVYHQQDNGRNSAGYRQEGACMGE